MGIGMLLKGVVGGIVIIAAVCITWPLQMIAVDGLYKQFVEHCTADGQELTRLYTRSTEDGMEDQLNLNGYIQLTFAQETENDANQCQGGTVGFELKRKSTTSADNVLATGATIVGTESLFIVESSTDNTTNSIKLYSEHNEYIQAASTAFVKKATDGSTGSHVLKITNAKYKTPIPIVKPYSNISLTVLGAIPVIGVISFLTMASVNFYRNQSMGGSDEIGKNIMWTIGGLIIMVVQMFAAPLVIGFINFAYVASGGANISGGPFQAMETFGEVIQIGFEFSPLLYILSMLGTLGYAGFRSFKDDVRGFVGRSGYM